jgi:hypothetical protein
MAHNRLAIGLALALFVATGCGPLKTRSAVPKDQVLTASLDGYDNVRFWGDESSEALHQTFVESWKQERAALKLADDDRHFPDSNYLAISGGGQNGAFGAGVLCGWTKRGDRPTFNVVTGISTGALAAPFAFLGPDYDQKLHDVYTSVDEKDIAIWQGFLALFRSDSAFNTAPLQRLAARYFDQAMLDRIAEEHRKGRRLFIGTTNLDAGRPVVWDIGRIACSNRPDRVELFRKVLLASAAIPAAFPPVYLKVHGADSKTYDEMHVDGGVTREMFLLPSELRLYELGAESGVERKSHLYIIRNAKYGPQYDDVRPRVGTIAARAIDVLIQSQAAGDLWTLFYEARDNRMSYRVTSIPEDVADDSKSLFDKAYMTHLFGIGYDLASNGKAWREKPSYGTTPPPKHIPAPRPATRPTTAPVPVAG